MGIPADDGVCPSLLSLDAGCLLHITNYLASPRDLAALQLCCTTFHHLLQPNAAWSRVVKFTHGFQLMHHSSTKAGSSSTTERLLRTGKDVNVYKGLCQLLHQASQDVHPVRFVALYTDGGVDVGNMHYWADHMLNPNSWAPFCAKYSDNVNSLAVLKTGPEAFGEFTHRERMIDCLKWIPPGSSLPPSPSMLNDANVAAAAGALAKWQTLRLETFFCQMAARAALYDPRALPMLRGMEGSTEERRTALRALASSILTHTWYQRAYHLHYMQLPKRLRGQAGSGPAGGCGGRGRAACEDMVAAAHEPEDSAYVMDENAVRQALMNEEAASSVAILHGMSVSRRGSLSCPVMCGALLAGLLPAGWPHTATSAVADAQARAKDLVTPQTPKGQSRREAGPSSTAEAEAMAQVMSHECLLRATLQQQSVAALDDMTDPEHVFAACAAGQLPPWVKHVVMEHAEFIEFLPPHLSAELEKAPVAPDEGAGPSAAAGSASGSAAAGSTTAGDGMFAALRRVAPVVHPVIWFRFKSHSQYRHMRRSARGRDLLTHVSKMCGAASDILAGPLDEALLTLRTVLEGMRQAPGEAQPHAAAAAGGVADAAAASSSVVATQQERGKTVTKAFHRTAANIMESLDRLVLLVKKIGAQSTMLQEEAGFTVPAACLERVMEEATLIVTKLDDIRRLVRMLGAGLGWKEKEGEEGEWRSASISEAKEGEEGMPSDERGGSGALDDEEGEDLSICLADPSKHLQAILEEPPLAPNSRKLRLHLAAALQRSAADAAAEVLRHSAKPTVQETRNEELLRCLPVQPPAPRKEASAAAASTSGAAASPPVDELPAAPQEQVEAGAAAAPPPLQATLEPAPPAGWAAEGLFDPKLQRDMENMRRGQAGGETGVHRVFHMYASLLFPVAANAVVFKATRPENLMQLVGWDTSEQPNVDIEYVGLQGRVVRLPPGLKAVTGV